MGDALLHSWRRRDIRPERTWESRAALPSIRTSGSHAMGSTYALRQEDVNDYVHLIDCTRSDGIPFITCGKQRSVSKAGSVPAAEFTSLLQRFQRLSHGTWTYGSPANRRLHTPSFTSVQDTHFLSGAPISGHRQRCCCCLETSHTRVASRRPTPRERPTSCLHKQW